MCTSNLYAEPELWFGSYTDTDGKLHQGRFNIELESGLITRIQLAPYGKPAIDFKVIKTDEQKGVVFLEWPSQPEKKCVLQQYSDSYYAGNWTDQTTVPFDRKKIGLAGC